jgi:hypothetical protein
MPRPAGTSLLAHFSALKDPRQQAKLLYPLPEILLLLLCATLAGADDLVEIALWGNQQLAFLRRFQPYRHAIPSHDTLGAVLAALDPALFKTCFVAWVEGLREDEPDRIAIDGKTARRAHARAKGREPLHLVSAPPAPWAPAAPQADRPQADGPAANGWCSARRRSTASRTRSPPSGCSWSAWRSKGPW